MKERSAATAVIIGGGVVGLSTAYHLARKRFGRIVVVEKDRVGAGASSRAGGIITGLLWTRTGIEARKISLALFREWSEELGPYGYQYQEAGCLNLFDAAAWPERQQLLPLYDELGAPYEILSPAEIEVRWSQLSVAPEIVGLFDPLGGYSEPHQFVPALKRRCQDLGVEICEQQAVTDFLATNGRIAGVHTPIGPLEADVVICTTHVWTRKLFERLGWSIPVKAFVHQRYVTAPLPEPLALPAINANPYGAYLRPADGNCILVGGETAERAEYPAPSARFHMSELTVASQFKEELRSACLPLLHLLRDMAWQTEHVGLLSFSMDGEPILGPAPELPGLILGTAFHSGGFAYSPVAGLLLAELASGEPTSIDLTDFAPARFDPRQVGDYLSARVAQKDAVARRH